MNSTWNSGIGKFPKKDPNHGWLWKKIKAFFGKFCPNKKCCKGKCKEK